MLYRALTSIQLQPWMQFKHVQIFPYTVRSIHRSVQISSKTDDTETKSVQISSKKDDTEIKIPSNFQEELEQDTYCPPLAQRIVSTYSPLRRSMDILGITGRNDPKTQTKLHFPHHCDIVIVGGGVIGCSIAYWIKSKGHDNGLNVVVVERDPSYTRASTVLSVGGLRQQFSLPENIQMSLYGAEFLRQSKKLLSGENLEGPDVQFNPYGYLFLASEKGAEQLIENHKLQM